MRRDERRRWKGLGIQSGVEMGPRGANRVTSLSMIQREGVLTVLGQRAPPCGQPAAISARPQLHTPLKLIILTLIISFTHSSFLFSLFFNTKTLYSLFTLFTLSSFNHTIPKKIRRRKKLNKNTQSQQFSTLLFSLFSLPFSPLMRRRRFDF